MLVAGTLDTKGEELRYIRDLIRAAGLPVRMVDPSTSGAHSGAEIPAHQIAAWHPRGAAGVFTGDRGAAVAGMTEAFARWIVRQDGIAGIISAAGSGGALDRVNFGAPDTVPARCAGRTVYPHNPQVTLMRTTPDECAAMGRWIAERLNRMEGPVRFLLPDKRVSALDAPVQPFNDPKARETLFAALESHTRQTVTRRLQRIPHHINDAGSAAALVSAFHDLHGTARKLARKP